MEKTIFEEMGGTYTQVGPCKFAKNKILPYIAYIPCFLL